MTADEPRVVTVTVGRLPVRIETNLDQQTIEAVARGVEDLSLIHI